MVWVNNPNYERGPKEDFMGAVGNIKFQLDKNE